jgi:SET domain-containing protein
MHTIWCVGLTSILLAYYELQVPSEAPFQLKPSPGKGWGVFATRKIKQGEVILTERPLFTIRQSIEKITEKDLLMAALQLEPHEKEQFLLLRDNGNASSPFLSMGHAFHENSWLVSENPQIRGLCLLHSRFNHSCIPNSKVPLHSGEMVTSFATRDIAPGEELTICYYAELKGMTRQERHKDLEFICDCKACQPGSLFQQLSDMRRTLIRGLNFLTIGVDPIGDRLESSPIIFNQKLRKEVQEFGIPLSVKLIYELLTMYLLEEEGLMDAFVVERCNPAILHTSTLFKTESNARIARLAVAQETWLEKLRVALRLDGREDAGDRLSVMALRRQHGLSVNP